MKTQEERLALQRIRSKKWRDANPDKMRACKKRWNDANHERNNASRRAWRIANPGKDVIVAQRWRANNPDAVKAISDRQDARLVARLLEQKTGKTCLDCGVSYPPCVLDFDHVRGTKVANVSALKWASTERFLAEIAKCDLVCANCHRIRTHQRRGR